MKRHFTASAFVIDSKKRVLLLWHKRLQRWMPPGGHVDPDETPEDAARRECKEETGLDVEIIGDEREDFFADDPREGRMLVQPISMLLEEIPAFEGNDYKPAEPPHQHMDFTFLARPLDESQPLILAEQEGRELRWFSLEEVDALPPQEVFCNVRNVLRSTIR